MASILKNLNYFLQSFVCPFADSSLFSTPRLKIARKNQISSGDTLWNDSGHTIKKLPAFLEGSILFQLPKKYILKGTSLKIKCPINSNIYIAYKGDRNSLSLQEQNWESKSDEISYECVKKALTLNDRYQAGKISKLSNISNAVNSDSLHMPLLILTLNKVRNISSLSSSVPTSQLVVVILCIYL